MWVGKPPYPEITSDYIYPYVWTTEYGYPAAKKYTINAIQDIVFYDENTNIYGGIVENFNWTWYLDDGGLMYDEYDYGIGGKMYIFYEAGIYRIRVRTANVCGLTDLSVPVYVEVLDEEFYLLLSPNPSTSETIISLESSDEAKSLNATMEEWDLEVYDQNQKMKAKIDKVRGKSTTLNTSGWKEGIYIVRAKCKDQVLTEKLVVKEL